MPINYSFNLYYYMEDLEKALLETAKIAEPRDKLIDVTLLMAKSSNCHLHLTSKLIQWKFNRQVITSQIIPFLISCFSSQRIQM